MELYEKAGDTFFNGSRNRDRAVEFYRVLVPPSVSLFMSLLRDGHGELCSSRVEGGEGRGPSGCAGMQTWLGGGPAAQTHL